jgi:hypothetical protein
MYPVGNIGNNILAVLVPGGKSSPTPIFFNSAISSAG